MSMLVVIHACDKDLRRAIQNLEWAIHLDGRADFRCLISTERQIDISTLMDVATRYFSQVDVFRYDQWRGPQEWPQPANNAWQETARFIESSGIKLPWFWWEQDAIPVKAGFLTVIAEAHRYGQRPFSGAVTQQLGQHYVAGVAVYPWNISNHLMVALLAAGQPWDIVASTRDGMLKKSHDITPLIAHTPDRDNTHFDSSEDIYKHIPDTAVIFHKCKDGSLLDVLQGKTPTEVANLKNQVQYPSFTEQTEWESGIFTFPTTTVPTAYFNCSIAEKDGDRWLFTRRQRFNTDPGAVGSSRNDLAIFRIRPNMTLDPTAIIPGLPNRYPAEQWEDPRATTGNDCQTYVAFSTWVHYKTWNIRQSFTRLTRDWRRFEVIYEPSYGGNSPKPEKASGHEKNWVWFEYGDKWYCVYMINPHTIFGVDTAGNPIIPMIGKRLELPWAYGEPRGGTPPIRIGEEYLCFFHSAVTWKKPKRRYFMGVYTFSAEPPFELQRITSEPLLVGSDQDFRVLGGPLVIFPNGALLDAGTWTIVFGVNDENCGWIKIPHGDIEKRLVPAGKRKTVLGKMMEIVGK